MGVYGVSFSNGFLVISGILRKSGFQGSLYLSRESLGNSILPLSKKTRENTQLVIIM
jgi:hypothetical protein